LVRAVTPIILADICGVSASTRRKSTDI